MAADLWSGLPFFVTPASLAGGLLNEGGHHEGLGLALAALTIRDECLDDAKASERAADSYPFGREDRSTGLLNEAPEANRAPG